MWLSKPIPSERSRTEDAYDWAQKETIRFAAWKCKLCGLATLISALLVVPFLAGMPWHAYWKWGVPLLIASMISSTLLLIYGGILLFESSDRRKRSRRNPN